MCRGDRVALTPFSLVVLLQTLACNVGGQTHTHTPESLAMWSIIALLIFVLQAWKSALTVTIKKSHQNRFELTGSLFQNLN